MQTEQHDRFLYVLVVQLRIELSVSGFSFFVIFFFFISGRAVD